MPVPGPRNGQPARSVLVARQIVRPAGVSEVPKDIPSTTPEGDAMSAALKKLGFRFVGPTVCYALMQSCGIVNDHPASTEEYKRVERAKARKTPA